MRPKLTGHYRYDGEDAEPEAAAPTAAPAKTEAEAPVTTTTAAVEANNDASATQQDDDDEAKPFDPSAEDMDGAATAAPPAYDTLEVDRTPVHMKDDG